MKETMNEEAVSPDKAVSTEEAVSPVIGTILMVAITVILAAVIAAFVFGMVGTTSTSKNVALTVSLGKSTAVTPVSDIGIITIQGGTDLARMNQLTYSIDGGVQANVTYLNGTSITPSEGYLNAGSLVATGGNPVKGKRLVLTGTFSDGTSQVLWDRTL